jgi:hypothetical protein
MDHLPSWAWTMEELEVGLSKVQELDESETSKLSVKLHRDQYGVRTGGWHNWRENNK